jgi:hypothetical protein
LVEIDGIVFKGRNSNSISQLCLRNALFGVREKKLDKT